MSIDVSLQHYLRNLNGLTSEVIEVIKSVLVVMVAAAVLVTLGSGSILGEDNRVACTYCSRLYVMRGTNIDPDASTEPQ